MAAPGSLAGSRVDDLLEDGVLCAGAGGDSGTCGERPGGTGRTSCGAC